MSVLEDRSGRDRSTRLHDDSCVRGGGLRLVPECGDRVDRTAKLEGTSALQGFCLEPERRVPGRMRNVEDRVRKHAVRMRA